jgi:hypothetical protein
LIYDEDLFGVHDVCGRTVDQKLFLRESRFEDFLSHDVMLKLQPQGRLLIRVQRLGEIDDVDFWVKKAMETLNFGAEYMVRTYADRVSHLISAFV